MLAMSVRVIIPKEILNTLGEFPITPRVLDSIPDFLTGSSSVRFLLSAAEPVALCRSANKVTGQTPCDYSCFLVRLGLKETLSKDVKATVKK